jgi:hypothetical protein
MIMQSATSGKNIMASVIALKLSICDSCRAAPGSMKPTWSWQCLQQVAAAFLTYVSTVET